MTYGVSSGFIGLPRASSGFLGLPRASSGFLGLPRASSGFLGLPRASSGGGIDSPATRQPVWVFAVVGRGFRTPPPLRRRWLRVDRHVFFFITLLMCAPALARRGDVAPSRRSGGVAPVPLPPVRLHSAAGPHLPAAPRPLPSVGPFGLRAERLRATPALFFRLHAVLHVTV